MTGAGSRFDAAVAAFDAVNAEDPNRAVDDGRAQPKELAYARRMTRWLARLAPDASEALRLAARAQHIRRWVIPRADYPRDRAGYLKWRSDLKRFHARLAGGSLDRAGYDAGAIARVQALLRKERLKQDAETQMLEDVACLVFLENDLAAFAGGHADDKVVDILRKTWKKMSPGGRTAALALDLPPAARALVEKAVRDEGTG